MRGRPKFWSTRGWIAGSLLPFSALFVVVVSLRRLAFRRGWITTPDLPVPVIVVGNITAGGSGKTPLVVALAEVLVREGWRVGIISRGYGGTAGVQPRLVVGKSNPGQCGDEPVLIAQRTGLPVVVDADRVAAAKHLLSIREVDVLLADDGLQHYRLKRDLELAVIDGRFRLGNGWPLPAGPLREGASRLDEVDYVVCNGGTPEVGEIPMRLRGDRVCALVGDTVQSLQQLSGRTVHAVAAIADPERFFATLRAGGLEVIEHGFPDHHRFQRQDLSFSLDAPILMTEKDAVKCRQWSDLDLWYLPVSAQLPTAMIDDILARLKSVSRAIQQRRQEAPISAVGES